MAAGKLAPELAKQKFLDHLSQGCVITDAAKRVGRTRRGYEFWRKSDQGFATQVDAILERRKGVTHYCPDFPEFCEEFLGQPLFEHQLRWWDILQGEEPRSLHDSMRWQPGSHEQMLLLNVPPGFGKSTTLTVNYSVWRICKDPNVRIVIVSATEKMAKKFLYAIKQRLTGQEYTELQRKFGPEGGFRATAESWTATEIYLGGKNDGEKDPTVQALGMGGQIYGARADLIIVDDAVLLKNAHCWEDQIDWLTQDVITRLPEGEPDAKLMVVGTRVGPIDMYLKLREGFRNEHNEPVFTYFAQPAVLEYADDPANWVSLWPETLNRQGEMVPKWSGPMLKSRRDLVKPATWALVYQQLDVSEDSVFDMAAVKRAVNGMRKPGQLMEDGAPGCRPGGMQGLYVIAGLDPATVGHTAAVVIAVDRHTRRRWLIDLYNKAGIRPSEMRELIQKWTVRYNINEWRIERNAFQRFLTQDDEVRAFLFNRGTILREHFTHSNKIDPDFGVASMTTLFELQKDGKPLLDLPCDNAKYPASAALVEQLATWAPDLGDKIKQDLVMALWFAEIRAREITFVAPQNRSTHLKNPFLARGRRGSQMVVNLDQVALERVNQGW